MRAERWCYHPQGCLSAWWVAGLAAEVSLFDMVLETCLCLDIGCRARISTLPPAPRRTGSGFGDKKPPWWRGAAVVLSLVIEQIALRGWSSWVAQSLSRVWFSVNPDCRPPGFSARGMFRARILEWAVVPCSPGSSQPKGRTHVAYVSSISRRLL